MTDLERALAVAHQTAYEDDGMWEAEEQPDGSVAVRLSHDRMAAAIAAHPAVRAVLDEMRRGGAEKPPDLPTGKHQAVSMSGEPYWSE
jgi:hypothetical protein